MSGFSAQWLALREPVDHRSRDITLQNLVAHDLEHLSRARPGPVKILDLGSGAGSNIRALAPHFPERQEWTLADYDASLLSVSRASLIDWADQTISNDKSLVFIKNGKHVTVEFRCVDLANNIESILSESADLITAAAFFDLVATPWLERFCQSLTIPFYTVLTYNGLERWQPPESSDAAMLNAFHAHQQTDKGFGVAAGPKASQIMEDLLRARGFAISTAQSPWKLDAHDQQLIKELATGSAGAVRETGLVPANMIDAWQQSRTSAAACEIGHTDLFARPRQF